METLIAGPQGQKALLGRARESELLDDLVSAVRRGESRSLVLRGEAGIGKTALLEYVLGLASDFTVLRTAGVESEMELAYAGLQLVCSPLLGRVGRLPAPQRQALEIVFGRTVGGPPDRFLVGLAVLSLFCEVADERPLLCVVDDAQWLDKASALTLAFVARRLLADRVGIVFCAREPGEELRDLPELEVRGLVSGDARALLGSAVRFKLDERVRDRIIAETQGNPLALLELPHGLTATQLAGGFGLLEPRRLPNRIEESFVRRIDALTVDARRLLLLAAAEPLGDPLLLLRAAQRLGIVVSAVEARTRTAKLLSVGARVSFRHPLVRSAVYRTAPVEERLAAHRALAEATDPVADPDRRAWHLASAATGPDEQVARELERSARRAQARGGLAATAAFLERAVELTAESARRADRALSAAEAGLQAGAFDVARGLLAAAEAGELDEFQRARADLLHGEIALSSGVGSGAATLLLKAAERLRSLDLDLARDTYLDALGAAQLAGPEGADARLQICRAVRTLPSRPQRPQRPRATEVLLEALALLVTEGRSAAASTVRNAARAFVKEGLSTRERHRAGWLASALSYAIWDNEGTRRVLARQIQLVRDVGALEQLPIYLSALGTATARTGDLATTGSLIAESEEVAAATGARLPPFAALMLAALRGREPEASSLVGAIIEQAVAEQGAAVTMAHYAASVLYNGLGRYEEALVAAQQACWDPVDLYGSGWALPELVEAATRSGRPELANKTLERLAAATEPAGTDWGRGMTARSQALLSEGATADALYGEAIDRLGRARLRPELGRAHLVYGEWLRRKGRRTDARDQLRVAHDEFIAIGMEAFAERARMELVATGEKVRKRRTETRDELTAQERQIAQLAREGLSNREIGTQLFLSHRTVESHLSKVYRKLGVRTRRELTRVLASSGSPTVGG